MSLLPLSCPDCRKPMTLSEEAWNCSQGHTFPVRDGVADLLPSSVDETLRGDAVYHSDQREVWVDANQINTPRNLYFHREVVNFMAERSVSDSNLLELGGGVGFDLELFLSAQPQFGHYVFSEIAPGMVSYTRGRTLRPEIFYCCVDAHNIPFDDETFDFVSMIATLHHFPDLERALQEIIRVLKPGGFLVCGVEPNRRWVELLARLRGLYRPLLPKKEHSPADEQTDGFTAADLISLGQGQSLKLVRLTPVWFFSGFLHLGLEFLYRALHLKKRLRLPGFLEHALLGIDRALLSIPFLRGAAWHYTAVYEKIHEKPLEAA